MEIQPTFRLNSRLAIPQESPRLLLITAINAVVGDAHPTNSTNNIF